MLTKKEKVVYELGLFKDCPRRDDWSSRSSLFLSVFCGFVIERAFTQQSGNYLYWSKED